MQLKTERLIALDILRGFALLGILMVNWEYFATPATTDWGWGARHFTAPADRSAAFLMQMFCDGKFILLFSFLFGYGLHVQMSRAPDWLPRYWKRLAGLLLLGILHATFLFVGDILTTYALLGAALLLFRHQSPRRLLLWTLFFTLLSVASHAILGWAAASLQEAAPDSAAVIAIYRHGSPGEIIGQRGRELGPLLLISPLLFFPQVMAMFLLGLALAKKGLWTDLRVEKPLWTRVFRWTLLPALAGNFFYVWLEAVSGGALAPSVWSLAGRGLFAPLGTLAYLSGFALLLGSPRACRVLAPLASDGRMSLSNYIGESVICGFICYSYGLGLFGYISPLDGLGLIVLIFAGQMILSDWWSLRFRSGPLEWLLRWWTSGEKPILQREMTSPTPKNGAHSSFSRTR